MMRSLWIGRALAALRARWTTRRRRVRTSTVLQMEAVECGAACLAIVLRYLGRDVPLETLRVDCNVSRDGTKASHLVAAAAQYGVSAQGYSVTPEALRTLPLPAVLHWNFNHFLVLEGFGRDRAFVNDPARGRYAVQNAELDRAFTGVALTFERTAAFVAKSERRSLWGMVARRAQHSWWSIALIVLASLGLVIPGLAVPAFTSVFVDEILVQGRREQFAPLLLLLIPILLLNIGFLRLQSHTLLRLQSKVSVSGAGAFLWHVLHLPLSFFDQRYSGDVAARVGINDRVAMLVGGSLANAVLAAITACGYLALMVVYDPTLTACAVITAVTSLTLSALLSRRRADANRRLLQDTGKLSGSTQHGLQMIESLKAAGAEADFFRRWAGHFAKVMSGKQHAGNQSAWFDALPGALSALNGIAILGVGGLRVIDGHMTVGMLVAFQYLVQSFLQPIEQLVSIAADAQVAAGDLERLEDVLAHPWAAGVASTPAETTATLSAVHAAPVVWPGPPKLEGHVEFRNVTFGYNPRGAPLLHDFSLTIPPGGRVALVGRSGCGKSTIAKLLCGLYQPWSGSILFDGWMRESIPRAVLTDSLALVDQHIVLFSDTIRANLTMWDHTVPHDQVVRAAMDAAIHDVIMARPLAYDGVVAERGVNFSGGQQQRLEIARALAAAPSILVLDEATSALDPTTEQRVMDNLRRRGCACVIIAHRLSTIRDCDEIIVLEHGRQVERGTHETLRAAGGVYADLIDELGADARAIAAPRERVGAGATT